MKGGDVVEKMKGKPSLFSKSEEPTEVDSEDEEVSVDAYASEEDDEGLVTAMEAFEAATTPSEKAQALKSFIKLCD